MVRVGETSSAFCRRRRHRRRRSETENINFAVAEGRRGMPNSVYAMLWCCIVSHLTVVYTFTPFMIWLYQIVNIQTKWMYASANVLPNATSIM